MLDVHGKDRRTPRIKGESTESYRIRLGMKNIIAQKAGTDEGILLALAAIGYSRARIEPFFKTDPSRWAEFLIYLGIDGVNTINDLYIIEKEIMKIKPASAKMSFMLWLYKQIDLATTNKVTIYKVPACNTIRCGTYPIPSKVGISIQTQISTSTKTNLTTTNPRICGTYPKQSTLGYIVQVSNNKTVHAVLATTNPHKAGTYPTQAIIGAVIRTTLDGNVATEITPININMCGVYKAGTHPTQSILGTVTGTTLNSSVVTETTPITINMCGMHKVGTHPTQAIIGTATTLLTSVSAVTTATKTMPRICGKYKCGEE